MRRGRILLILSLLVVASVFVVGQIPNSTTGGGGGSGSSNLTVKVNSSAVGSPRDTINLIPGAGMSAAGADTGSQINVTYNAAAFTGDSGSGGALGAVPAPASGDAANGLVLGADGTWISPGQYRPDPRVAWVVDEMAPQGSGALTWSVSNVQGTGSITNTNGSVIANPYILSLNTASASNNDCSVMTAAASTTWAGNFALTTTSEWESFIVFKLASASGVFYQVGFYGNGSDLCTWTDGVSVRFNSSSDTDFTLTGYGGGGGTQALGTAGEASNFHTARFRNPGDGKIYVSIDGGTEYTACAAGCTVAISAANSYRAMFVAKNISGAGAAKRLDIDFYSFWTRKYPAPTSKKRN